MAGADIPVAWQGSAGIEGDRSQTVLPPLKWKNDDEFHHTDSPHYDPAYDSDLDEEVLGEELFRNFEWQDLAGHLRKEAYSRQSERSLRHKRKCAKGRTIKLCDTKDVPCGCPSANRTLY
jgi:hypothetical protein